MLLKVLRSQRVEEISLDIRVKDYINEGSPEHVKILMKTDPDMRVTLDIGIYQQTLKPGLLNLGPFKLYESIAEVLGIEDVLNLRTEDVLRYFMAKDSKGASLSYEDTNRAIRQFLVNAADINPEIRGGERGVRITKVGENDFDLSKMKDIYEATSGIHAMVGKYCMGDFECQR